MSISKELFLALLSMDVYNRGYGSGISGLDDADDTAIGTAQINTRLQDVSVDFVNISKTAGFYAIAYTAGDGIDGIASGTTIITYRGTDNFRTNDTSGG